MNALETYKQRESLSDTQLGRMLGVKANVAAAICRGDQKPSPAMSYTILKKTGVILGVLDELERYKFNHDLTDDDLADLVGVHRAYMSRIRRGERTPSPEIALAIYKKIGVRIGILKGKTPDQIAVLQSCYRKAAA